MANSFPTTTSDDGVRFQIRPCAIDNGKTPIRPVEVPYAHNITEVADYIDKGVYSEQHVCGLLVAQLAIEIQAAARRAAVGGAIPKRDYARLFKSISVDELTSIQTEEDDPKAAIDILINELYQAEQQPSTTASTKETGNGKDE